MKRICKKCGHTIRRTERWKNVRTTRLWFFTRKHVEHHDCLHPYDGPVKTVKRLAGEVPLPFPDTLYLTQPGHMDEYQRRNVEEIKSLAQDQVFLPRIG